MGKSSREKGKRGELELVAELRRLGFDNVRRAQQYCGTESSADILGLKNVHIECKRCESLSIYQAMQQATRDAGETQDPDCRVGRECEACRLSSFAIS